MSGNLLIDITTVRMTLDRLLAQDSWEAPYVTAAHAALDRIVAHPDGTLNETAPKHLSPSEPGQGSPARRANSGDERNSPAYITGSGEAVSLSVGDKPIFYPHGRKVKRASGRSTGKDSQ